jgi:hypothetical protein
MITGNESSTLLDLLGFCPETNFSKLCPSLTYEDHYSHDENCYWPYLACQRLQDAYETIVWNDPRSHAPYTPNEDALFEDIPF